MEEVKFQDEIVQNFKDLVGTTWDAMPEKEKKLLQALAKDAAKLHFKALTSSAPLDREIAIVNASLGNFTVAKYFSVKKVFWQAVERAATIAVQALVKAALGAVIAI
jgi:hypothetical protein